jgi:uncharacterized protein (TIGR00725 family)
LSPSVAVFGSSRAAQDSLDYRNAVAVGHEIAKRGGRVVCGGGGGVMEAACRGAAEAGGKSLGVVIGDAAPNRWVTDVVREGELAARLRRLRDESGSAIFFPRGLGTMLELAWMVESVVKGEIAPRPLVFLGLFWRRTVALALSEATGRGAESLAGSVSFASSGAEAVSRAIDVQPLTR